MWKKHSSLDKFRVTCICLNTVILTMEQGFAHRRSTYTLKTLPTHISTLAFLQYFRRHQTVKTLRSSTPMNGRLKYSHPKFLGMGEIDVKNRETLKRMLLPVSQIYRQKFFIPFWWLRCCDCSKGGLLV